MARMLICCACLCEVATIGRRCEQCAPIEERPAKRKPRSAAGYIQPPDPAGLLALAEKGNHSEYPV
jgi:hypothetical protein